MATQLKTFEGAAAMPAPTWHTLKMNDTSIELPAGLTALPTHYTTGGTVRLLQGCSALKEIIFPDNIATIPAGTFDQIGANPVYVCTAGTTTAATLTEYGIVQAVIMPFNDHSLHQKGKWGNSNVVALFHSSSDSRHPAHW